MKVGLIGPPQSGKSTLFGSLTGHLPDPAQLAMEHEAVIKVPDERLDHLASIYKPKKVTHATINVSDYPGLSTRDEHGKQVIRKHLPSIRLCDVLVAVVRAFENDAVTMPNDRIDPQADLSSLYDDFIFADMEAVANRMEKLENALRKPTKGRDQHKKELDLFERCRQALENLQLLSSVPQNDEEALMLRSFAFLTERPLLVVVNVSESQVGIEPGISYEHARQIIAISAELEEEIAELNEQDRDLFLKDLGIEQTAQERFIRACYEVGGLISFFTVGENEVRAWPIRGGLSAVEAAGKIHSDMARGFIRAETVSYADFVKTDDMKGARAAGTLRQEGKDYIVQDGDIILFKFNV